MSDLQLCLHHDLTLLVLDDTGGSFNGTMIEYGVAGAILSELLLQGFLKVSPDDEKLVAVAIDKTTGDPILDEVIKMIAESKNPESLQTWVYNVACISKLCHRVAQQLVDLGILEFNENKILWLFTQNLYPEIDSSYEKALRNNLAEAMFTKDLKVSERTAVLISFAKSTGALHANFAPVELKKHDSRINEICEGKQLASGATADAIAAVQACMTAVTVASTIAATTAINASS